MFKMSRIVYGGTAAVVASTALISGLYAANSTRTAIVSALLIAALADNLADALSIHVFQESEHRDKEEAFTRTMTNFGTRLLLCISFALLVVLVPLVYATKVAIVWGMLLLAALTYLVARERKVKPMLEVIKHLLVASAVIIVSMAIGRWIGTVLR